MALTNDCLIPGVYTVLMAQTTEDVHRLFSVDL